MVDLSAVRIRGPVEPFAAGFGAELVRLGYTPFSARGQLELAAHLSRWLAEQGLGVEELTAPVVEAFLVARRAAGYRAYRSAKALVPLLAYLRARGAVPWEPQPVPSGPAEVLLEDFRRYLLVERDLESRVVRGYLDLVRPFVVALVERQVDLDLVAVGAGDVTEFLTAQSRRLAPKTVQRLASALRSLLRWWHLDKKVAVSLVEAVPKVAYRSPALPKALPPIQVEALLASCDVGCRDGLCHGKGRKDRITPLTPTTVATLRSWFTERAGAPEDPLFPSNRGTAMSTDALQRRISRHAAAAVSACPSLLAKNVTPHVLRHTVAMRLLHAGVDTTVIALWLGHESVNTTQIYLQADLALKQQALDRTAPLTSMSGRYHPPDPLLAFLESL